MCGVYRQAVSKGKWPMFVQMHRSHVSASIHKLHTYQIYQLWELHICVRVVQYAAKPGVNETFTSSQEYDNIICIIEIKSESLYQ